MTVVSQLAPKISKNSVLTLTPQLGMWLAGPQANQGPLWHNWRFRFNGFIQDCILQIAWKQWHQQLYNMKLYHKKEKDLFWITDQSPKHPHLRVSESTVSGLLRSLEAFSRGNGRPQEAEEEVACAELPGRENTQKNVAYALHQQLESPGQQGERRF